MVYIFHIHHDKNMVQYNIDRKRNYMELGTNKGGRPAGRIKTAKIEIALEPSVKEDFMSLLHSEGKTASVQIGEWIKDYIAASKNKGAAI